METYLYKRPERQKLKIKLSKLTNVAKRRNLVDVMVMDKDESDKTVKQITNLDKKRIGFRPEKGHNQWTRSCQNSGKDKRRRPWILVNENELRKKGFKLNKNNGVYEKKVTITKDRKKKIL